MEYIDDIIGIWGKFQLRVNLLIGLSKFFAAEQILSFSFFAPSIVYRCNDTGTLSPEGIRTCPCTIPIYDRLVFSRTIVMEWGLICDRKWLTYQPNQFFLFGLVLGSVMYGCAADGFGRKNALVTSVVILITFGIVQSFVPDYWVFTIFRFIVGTSVGGSLIITSTLIMELMSAKTRDMSHGFFFNIFYCVGFIILPFFGYLYRDYADFNLAITIPTISLVLMAFFIPESPQWLIATTQTEEAIKVLEYIAKQNHHPLQNIRQDVYEYQNILQERYPYKSATINDLFRLPRIRKNLFWLSYNWMMQSFNFFVLIKFVGTKTTNIFVKTAVPFSFTSLGVLSFICMTKFVGRRTLLLIFQVSTVISIALLTFVPKGVPLLISSSLGVASSFQSVMVAYLYTTELFPTVIRCTALGLCLSLSRVAVFVVTYVIALTLGSAWVLPLIILFPTILGVFYVLKLPETKGVKVMHMLDECENFLKNKQTTKVLPKKKRKKSKKKKKRKPMERPGDKRIQK